MPGPDAPCVQAAVRAKTCVASMRLSFNVADGVIGSACTGTLFHTIETVSSSWTMATLTWTVASSITPDGTILFTGSSDGYGSGSGRYVLWRQLQRCAGIRGVHRRIG